MSAPNFLREVAFDIFRGVAGAAGCPFIKIRENPYNSRHLRAKNK
jgi:hypothetical protein